MPLAVFTGDSLFSGDVGRPDLFGEDLQKELTQQIFETMDRYRAMPTPPAYYLLLQKRMLRVKDLNNIFINLNH